MGIEGLAELSKFVREGGTLITEGSTATIFPEYGITPDVTVEDPTQLFVRGSILRGQITDPKSPIMYGYTGSEVPVYFNQSPVLSAGGRGGGPAAAAPNGGLGQSITPNAAPLRITTFDPDRDDQPPPTGPGGPGNNVAERPTTGDVAQVRDAAAGVSAAAGRGRGGDNARPRVVMQFPSDPAQMLLSGTLANGQALSNRAIAIDAPLGKGHVVMFAIRPFWRWQTQGTYTLGFNAIMNWNDLDAGR